MLGVVKALAALDPAGCGLDDQACGQDSGRSRHAWTTSRVAQRTSTAKRPHFRRFSTVAFRVKFAGFYWRQEPNWTGVTTALIALQ